MCRLEFFRGNQSPNNILRCPYEAPKIGKSTKTTDCFRAKTQQEVITVCKFSDQLQSDPMTQAVIEMSGPVSMAALTTLLPGYSSIILLQNIH